VKKTLLSNLQSGTPSILWTLVKIQSSCPLSGSGCDWRKSETFLRCLNRNDAASCPMSAAWTSSASTTWLAGNGVRRRGKYSPICRATKRERTAMPGGICPSRHGHEESLQEVFQSPSFAGRLVRLTAFLSGHVGAITKEQIMFSRYLKYGFCMEKTFGQPWTEKSRLRKVMNKWGSSPTLAQLVKPHWNCQP
jgi:hypothetical protein